MVFSCTHMAVAGPSAFHQKASLNQAQLDKAREAINILFSLAVSDGQEKRSASGSQAHSDEEPLPPTSIRSIDPIDYVHGIGNRNDSAHVTIKTILVLTVRSLRIESLPFEVLVLVWRA